MTEAEEIAKLAEEEEAKAKLAAAAKKPRKLSKELSKTRDVDMIVDVRILSKGCFFTPDSNNPTDLREYGVGDEIEVTVGRADGMRGKVKILSKPRKPKIAKRA